MRSDHFSGSVQVRILNGQGTSFRLIRLPQNSMAVNLGKGGDKEARVSSTLWQRDIHPPARWARTRTACS